MPLDPFGATLFVAQFQPMTSTHLRLHETSMPKASPKNYPYAHRQWHRNKSLHPTIIPHGLGLIGLDSSL
jgi:hypothetical protein